MTTQERGDQEELRGSSEATLDSAPSSSNGRNSKGEEGFVKPKLPTGRLGGRGVQWVDG